MSIQKYRKIVSCKQKNNMNKFLKYTIAIALAVVVFSCNKSEDSYDPPRPYQEVYNEDIAEIEDFMKTHYIEVDADFNVEFIEIETGGTQTPIWDMPEKTSKIVYIEQIPHTIYYLKLQEGIGERPSMVDSTYISYKGMNFYDNNGVEVQNVFDQKITPDWFKLDKVVRGWREILSEFKVGDDGIVGSDGTVTYSNYGAGVMFLPSALGYYDNSLGTIPAYSPLVFQFKQMKLRYRDHDGDKVLSKYEISAEMVGDNPVMIDSDQDGTYDFLDTDDDDFSNYLDPDDDGDGLLTKAEVKYDSNGDVIIPFHDCDGDGIPDYLDTNPCP